jgi:hypothetical protein
MRVLREDRSLFKRGNFDTELERRLGYLQGVELQGSSRALQSQLRLQKFLHYSSKRCLVLLKISRPLLKQAASVALQG